MRRCQSAHTVMSSNDTTFLSRVLQLSLIRLCGAPSVNVNPIDKEIFELEFNKPIYFLILILHPLVLY